MESEGHLPAFAYTITLEMNLNPFAKDTVNVLMKNIGWGHISMYFKEDKTISLVLCLDP